MHVTNQAMLFRKCLWANVWQKENFMARNTNLVALRTGLLLVGILSLVMVSAARAQSTLRMLHKFERGTAGNSPASNLIFDKAGNLYGTTFFGGDVKRGACYLSGCGVVFKLAPNADGSWTESVLYAFIGGNDGEHPDAGLIFDAEGNLYGTTFNGGGANNRGTVFKLSPNGDGTWSESVLYSFCASGTCSDGGQPYGGLIFDAAGNLYGTAVVGANSAGNCNTCGVVYELTPQAGGSWTESVLYAFTGGNDGSNPNASLIFDPAGNLYGTTAFGGAGSCRDGVELGCGVVFELTPNGGGSWKENVLYSFAGTDGAYPESPLIFDSKGNLYGTTAYGGYFRKNQFGFGVVFELTPKSNGSWTETVLRKFTGTQGINPNGLIFDAAGNLWGTSENGGQGFGTVFKLTPNGIGGWRETVVEAFRDHQQANPRAGLISDGVGNLYGTTFGNGTQTFGSVFEIKP
jgi:uncharacterized repeat protein (TIGR03803 family)